MTIVRILIVVGLLAVALTLSVQGTSVIPTSIAGLATQADGNLQTIARIGIGVLIATAGAILLLGRRGYGLALLATMAIAFIGVADVAASITSSTAGGLLWPIGAIVIGCGMFVALTRTKPTTHTNKPAAAHPALTTAGVLGSMVVGAIVAANVLPPDTRTTAQTGVTYSVVDFPLGDWPGQTLEESGLLEYLPALPTLVEFGGPTVLAFYTPHCHHCHEFFDEEFGERRGAQVIAIKVPAAEGVEAADPTLDENVTCATCTMLTLPKGPVWLIQSPLIVTIAEGRITCVAQHDDPLRQRTCIAETERLATAADDAATQTPLEEGPPSEAR